MMFLDDGFSIPMSIYWRERNEEIVKYDFGLEG